MDMKFAFHNRELKETVYVIQPPDFLDNNNHNKVLRLHKALYGLRQAPRAWNAKLDNILLSLKSSIVPLSMACTRMATASSD